MALFKTALSGSFGGNIYQGETVTEEDNISSGAGTLYAVRVDATRQTALDPTVRFYNSLNPTIGTDAAYHWVKCPKGLITEWTIPEGLAFGTGISIAVVTNEGGTAGTDTPAGRVDLQVEAT